MAKYLIFHNSRCSKSRQTLELLQSKSEDIEVFEYLKTAMTSSLLKDVFSALEKRPSEVLRTKEDEFKALDLDLNNDSDVIEAIISHPKILERPIVLNSATKKARIGRPPESILEII